MLIKKRNGREESEVEKMEEVNGERRVRLVWNLQEVKEKRVRLFTIGEDHTLVKNPNPAPRSQTGLLFLI